VSAPVPSHLYLRIRVRVQVSDLTALLQLRMRYQMSPLTPHAREHAGRMRVESLFLVYADIRVQ
jgi:hypothetical protein